MRIEIEMMETIGTEKVIFVSNFVYYTWCIITDSRVTIVMTPFSYRNCLFNL